MGPRPYKYNCECAVEDCNLKIEITKDEYEWLADHGYVRHKSCVSVSPIRVTAIAGHDGHAVAVKVSR